MRHETITQPRVFSLVNRPLSTSEARDHLDHEIAALASVLCNLRAQRNTFSPVSHLPPEILASIFIQCATHSSSLQKSRRSVPDWVNISYVCRRWRDVALNCSSLWSFVFVSSKHWTDELLARSKAAPLKVRIGLDYTMSMQATELDLLKKVASQANRLQELCLRLTRSGAEIALPLLSSPAPLLRTLRISVERLFHLGETTVVSEVPFNGHLPALRELELINYTFSLTCPALYGLTSLRVRDLGASFRPTLASLLVALSRMQNLAHLHLENALPSARVSFIDPPFQGPEKLSFPKLSRLSIIAPLTTVILLLTNFHIPLKAEVRLRCGFDIGDEDYSQLYTLLAEQFIASRDQTTAPPIIRTFFVEAASATVSFIFSTAKSKSSRTFSTSAISYDPDRLHEDWDCNIPLKLDIVRGPPFLDSEDLVGGVYRSMPLTNLQSAHFSFDSTTSLSSGFWNEIFGHLPKLRHIKLSGADMCGLILALPPTFHLPNNQNGNQDFGPVRIFAPALKKLEFYGMMFSEECRGHSEDLSNKYPCGMACLSDALSKRHAGGYGLSQLVLAQCTNIRVCDVESLGGSVTDVVWDGVTRPVLHLESEDED